MKITDIIIAKSFLANTPSEHKMKECRDYWNKHHEQDRYVVINHENVLIDGYVQYLILKEKDVQDVEIRKSHQTRKKWRRKVNDLDKKANYRYMPTTYIFGKHVHQATNKVYVWRVPHSWEEWVDDLEIGDVVFVNTKYGMRPIVVQDIEFLATCPFQKCVKRIAKKTIVKYNNDLGEKS